MDVQIAMEQRKEAEYEQMVMSNNNNNNKPKQRVKHKKKKSIQPIITRSITHHSKYLQKLVEVSNLKLCP